MLLAILHRPGLQKLVYNLMNAVSNLMEAVPFPFPSRIKKKKNKEWNCFLCFTSFFLFIGVALPIDGQYDPLM